MEIDAPFQDAVNTAESEIDQMATSMTQRVLSKDVAAVFEAYPTEISEVLFALRSMTFEVWDESGIDCPLIETLKWGQPAYLPAKPRIGSTLRLGATRNTAYAGLFVHCQTTILQDFLQVFPEDFRTEGNRAILFRPGEGLQAGKLRHFINLALTYHRRKHVAETSL